MKDTTKIIGATYSDDTSGLKLDVSKQYTIQEIYFFEAKNITKATLKYLSKTPNKKIAPFTFEFFSFFTTHEFNIWQKCQIKKQHLLVLNGF